MKIIILVMVGAILTSGLVIWLSGERWRLLRRSTWEVAKAGGMRNLLNFKTLHFYVYLRFYNFYVKTVTRYIVPRIGKLGAKKIQWFADLQHSKVLTPEMAQAIITNDKEIPLHDLDLVIPYSMARDLVLKASPEVAVLDCPCRHARQDPCQPTEVCMIIGQPFVDFCLEHHPESGRRITQSEALELLRAEHKRGHVHTAWFKDALLNRFYAICNCCECCCGGIEAMTKYGIPVIVPSGYVALVDEENCDACATCEDACPFGAITMDEAAVIDWETCMGCEVCVGQCPNEAISLKRNEKRGTPLDVRLMSHD